MHIQAIYLFICMYMARGIVGRKVTLEYSAHARHINGTANSACTFHTAHFAHSTCTACTVRLY